MSTSDTSGSASQHSHPHNNTVNHNKNFCVDQPPPWGKDRGGRGTSIERTGGVLSRKASGSCGGQGWRLIQSLHDQSATRGHCTWQGPTMGGLWEGAVTHCTTQSQTNPRNSGLEPAVGYPPTAISEPPLNAEPPLSISCHPGNGQQPVHERHPTPWHAQWQIPRNPCSEATRAPGKRRPATLLEWTILRLCL